MRSTPRRGPPSPPAEALFAVAEKKAVPFAFVLHELDELAPTTKPMFGCTAVYVRDQIVFILRDRPTYREDNGVWVATTPEHHASLRGEFAGLRSIGVLGPGETGWQCLPADDPGFEDNVLRACALVRAGDARIGKVPARRSPRGKAASPSKGEKAPSPSKGQKAVSPPKGEKAARAGAKAARRAGATAPTKAPRKGARRATKGAPR
ncbi:MAG TPA: hypothetical protein VFS43_09125 [Polyangiaceae bacterium]|nr:hypothetical protein [Polyangiaceae bacterium]